MLVLPDATHKTQHSLARNESRLKEVLPRSELFMLSLLKNGKCFCLRKESVGHGWKHMDARENIKLGGHLLQASVRKWKACSPCPDFVFMCSSLLFLFGKIPYESREADAYLSSRKSRLFWEKNSLSQSIPRFLQLHPNRKLAHVFILRNFQWQIVFTAASGIK